MVTSRIMAKRVRVRECARLLVRVTYQTEMVKASIGVVALNQKDKEFIRTHLMTVEGRKAPIQVAKI